MAAFGRHGAATISSDEVVHELYEDPDVKAALRKRFGTDDRAAVRGRAVADRDALIWLEGLLHPRVVERTEAWRDELAREPDPPELAVNEVPLLYEAGVEGRFDAVVVITAPEETRRARTEVADVAERQGRLLSDDEKAGKADFVYVNDGSLEDLDAFVRSVVQRLAP